MTPIMLESNIISFEALILLDNANVSLFCIIFIEGGENILLAVNLFTVEQKEIIFWI